MNLLITVQSICFIGMAILYYIERSKNDILEKKIEELERTVGRFRKSYNILKTRRNK